MLRPRPKKILLTTALATSLCVASSGCCQVRRCLGFDDPCADIPAGAIPQPPGTYACEWQTAQERAAEADAFVVYQYEWLGDGTKLGPFGQRHIEEIATRLTHEPFVVTVESSNQPEIDTARRDVIVSRLLATGITDAAERVSIGWPTALPLAGREANRIESGFLRGGSRGGSSQGNSGSGSFGGSGLGSGGGFY